MGGSGQNAKIGRNFHGARIFSSVPVVRQQLRAIYGGSVAVAAFPLARATPIRSTCIDRLEPTARIDYSGLQGAWSMEVPASQFLKRAVFSAQRNMDRGRIEAMH